MRKLNSRDWDMRGPKTDVVVRLTGTDGNVFAVIGTVRTALKEAGHPELAKEFTEACFAAGSYDAVLRLCMAYVNVE